jgi:streptomycin 6-kinase
VLKIGIPSPAFTQEAKALDFYRGNGCVKLLGYDSQKSGMLLALIDPGTTLRSFFPEKDKQAVEYACRVMKKLYARSIDSIDFPTIDSWFSLFHTLEVPKELQNYVTKADELSHELRVTAKDLHLLHGDLHHDNILLDASGSGVAIDPKGVIGETAYEVGAFMCNPAELSAQPDIGEILARRLEQFSQILTIDQQRLAQACYVRIILSACWTVEAHGDWHDDVSIAQHIISLVTRN